MSGKYNPISIFFDNFNQLPILNNITFSPDSMKYAFIQMAGN